MTSFQWFPWSGVCTECMDFEVCFELSLLSLTVVILKSSWAEFARGTGGCLRELLLGYSEVKCVMMRDTVQDSISAVGIQECILDKWCQALKSRYDSSEYRHMEGIPGEGSIWPECRMLEI